MELIKMNIKNIKEVLNLLVQSYNDENIFDYTETVQDGVPTITIFIYNGDEGWQEKQIFFDKEGNYIPNYEKMRVIENKIKELQAELKKLKNFKKNY